MEAKFFYDIKNILKERLGGIHRQDFLKSIDSKDLNQILEEMRQYTVRDYQSLMAVNVFERLYELEPDAKSVEAVIEAHEIIKNNPEMIEYCYFQLDSVLRRIIMETTSLQQLYSLSNMAKRLVDFNEMYKESFSSMENQFISLLYDNINEIYVNNNEKSAIEGAKYLKSFIKLGYDLSCMAEVFFDPIITFINERNFLLYENDYRIAVNVPNDLKIIDYMMKCQLSEESVNRLRSVEEVLQARGTREVKKKDRIRDFEEYQIENKDLSYLNVNNEFNVATDAFDVTFKNAIHNTEIIMLKEYTVKDSLKESERLETLKKFETEAKCYDFLHKMYGSQEDSKFVKFFGCSLENNTFKLAYESYGKHLEYRLEEFRKINRKIDKKDKLMMVKDLLDAFTELENHNIYHQNISLSSIRVNESLKIKIADFDYAAFDESSCTNSKDLTRQITYWPEMMEKSKGKLGKQDVFALGLVILQMYTLEYIKEPKNEDYLKNSIKQVKETEIQDLLHNMLTFNCSERLRFKNLGKTYFYDGTESKLSSHIGSFAGSVAGSDA